MKQTKKETKLKDTLKANRRISEINGILSRQQAQPLKKKIFAGHWRFLIVRKDVLRSSIGAVLQTIVENCNHWILGKKGKRDAKYLAHAERDAMYYCTKEILSGKRVIHMPGQWLQSLSQEGFDEIKLTDSQKRRWFTPFVYRSHNVGTKVIEIKRYLPKVPEHMLEFAYKRGYFTEETIPNGDLESELHKLNEFMTQEARWNLIYTNRRDEWDLNISKKRILKKTLEKEVREHTQD